LRLKRFKDPIYGYVDIDADIVSGIIDTACFQRLKNIRQTSYAPLYPASFHNRFLHSIGVFYLGMKAFDVAFQSLNSQDESINYDHIRYLFKFACLLHDVGHAPFSHTGEEFYLSDKGAPTESTGNLPFIYEKLIALVDNECFTLDLRSYYPKNAAAPHEIMSCIVSLEMFKEYFKDSFDRDFFSRCITGFRYKSSPNNDILNCFIELLNSQTLIN